MGVAGRVVVGLVTSFRLPACTAEAVWTQAAGLSRAVQHIIKMGRRSGCGPQIRAAKPVTTPTSIFVNGTVGVFAGIAMLYLLMKILAATLGRRRVNSTPSGSKTD